MMSSIRYAKKIAIKKGVYLKMTQTKKKKIELKRVNMNLPADLVQKVVEYGESKGLNTTSAYIVLLNQGLEQKKAMEEFPLFVQLMQQYSYLNDQNNDEK